MRGKGIGMERKERERRNYRGKEEKEMSRLGERKFRQMESEQRRIKQFQDQWNQNKKQFSQEEGKENKGQ